MTPSVAHGADIGWLSWLESRGYRWLDADGRPEDPLVLLAREGIDSLRLRVMVDPDEASGAGFTDPERVTLLAQRCRSAGFDLMVDFHLSDTWADPAHQTMPAAWRGSNLDQLASHVERHVGAVLARFQRAGIAPRWVQVGNEIPLGLLWAADPREAGGKVDGEENWASLARLINAGYRASKERFPEAEVIVHLDRGYDRGLHQAWFDRYSQAGGLWDVSGVSFYPYWQPEGTVVQLRENLENLTQRYGKPTLVCEVGGRADAPRETRDLLLSVLEAARAAPRCQGVFYWEPLASPEAVGGYLLGSCVSAGGKDLKFNGALGAFRAFRNKNSK